MQIETVEAAAQKTSFAAAPAAPVLLFKYPGKISGTRVCKELLTELRMVSCRGTTCVKHTIATRAHCGKKNKRSPCWIPLLSRLETSLANLHLHQQFVCRKLSFLEFVQAGYFTEIKFDLF